MALLSAAPAAEVDLDGLLCTAHELAVPAAALGAALWGLAQDVEELPPTPLLPPLVGSPDDEARLQAVAPLYVASELEQAGLVPAMEALAGMYVSGGLALVDPEVEPKLVQLWETRHQRFTAAERAAIFARLFDEGSGPTLASAGARNVGFENLLIDLADTIYSSAPGVGRAASPSAAIGIRTTAQALAANLTAMGHGIPDQAAVELIAGVRTALDIFGDVRVQQAVGARSVWSAVESASRRYLQVVPDVHTRVPRAQAGMVLLAWLAGAVRDVEGPQPLPPVDPTVVVAAGRWMEATLALRESQAPAPSRT